MPPKKGKKKKSGKKGKKSGKRSGKDSGKRLDETQLLSAESQNDYCIQIKDLEKQIEFYQRKCDDLEIMNGMFDTEFAQTNEDQIDISEHLDILLKIRVDEITKLNSELAKLQELRDQEKAAFEEQIVQKKAEFDEIVDQLSSDKRIKTGQLASMEEFKIQKEELMQKFADLHDEIRQLEESNKEDIYQKERAVVVEMDRLKKEMVTRVNDVASEYRKSSNRQMAETNKKTIKENVELSTMIRKKSERTIELLEENDRLHSVEGENKRQIEISETVEKELLRKHNKNIEAIKYWVEECRRNEAEIAQFESEEHKAAAEAIKSENEYITFQRDSLESEWKDIQAESGKLKRDKEDVESEITSWKKNYKVHHKLVNRTKAALINAENLANHSEEFTEGEVIMGRQAMLFSLLELLNCAATLGFGLEPRQFGRQRKPIKI